MDPELRWLPDRSIALVTSASVFLSATRNGADRGDREGPSAWFVTPSANGRNVIVGQFGRQRCHECDGLVVEGQPAAQMGIQAQCAAAAGSAGQEGNQVGGVAHRGLANGCPAVPVQAAPFGGYDDLIPRVQLAGVDPPPPGGDVGSGLAGTAKLVGTAGQRR